MTKTSKHHKIVLLLVLLVTLGPFLFAYTLYQRANATNMRLNNHGSLISPLINVAKNQAITGETLLGKWWLVYVGPKNCQQECKESLYNLKQIRTALGKDTQRVERLFIAHPDCPQNVCETVLSEYPDIKRIYMSAQEFHHLFAEVNQKIRRETMGEIYIIDPLGNIMMHYSADVAARDVLSDVKRLLRISKIG